MILFVGIIPKDYYDKINNLMLYVFEVAYNYIETGHATTTSSSHLINDMYFPISLKTLLLGDGKYAGETTAYYLGTDAGYMRNVLLFGVGGLIMCLLIDFYLLWGNYKLRNNNISRMSICIFIYMCLLHIKGETFGYLLTFHCMLFLIYFSYVFSYKSNYVTEY